MVKALEVLELSSKRLDDLAAEVVPYETLLVDVVEHGLHKAVVKVRQAGLLRQKYLAKVDHTPLEQSLYIQSHGNIKDRGDSLVVDELLDCIEVLVVVDKPQDDLLKHDVVFLGDSHSYVASRQLERVPNRHLVGFLRVIVAHLEEILYKATG